MEKIQHAQGGIGGYVTVPTRGRVFPVRAALVIMLVVACCEFLSAQARKPTEYEVKAAYLYNFGRFVRWPATVTPAKGEGFSMCVLGRNPFGSSLDSTVSGESIDGKRLTVRYISGVSDANGCRIVFICGSEERRIVGILAELSKRPILTVSDIPRFVDHGGDIGFIQVDEKIRFNVNLAAAQKSGLVLSSDLLKVAVSVKRDGQSGE